MIVAGKEIDERSLAAVCDTYGIARLHVFGSAARGEAGKDSDIDVLYTMRPNRRLGWEIEQLSDELEELFGRPVDLVGERAVNDLLRPAVMSEARLLYAA